MHNPYDPLGLFTSDDLLTNRPIGTNPQPGGGSDFSTLIIGMLIAFALMLGYQRIQQDRDGDRQHQEQIDDSKDDQKQSDDKQSKSAGKTLVFIHERNPQSIEHDLLLREMPKFCEANKLQFRAYDDDMPDDPIPGLIAYAKTQGVDPPFVVLTGTDDKPKKASKWPSDIDQLKKFIK
jgi:hypothetical protein